MFTAVELTVVLCMIPYQTFIQYASCYIYLQNRSSIVSSLFPLVRVDTYSAICGKCSAVISDAVSYMPYDR